MKGRAARQQNRCVVLTVMIVLAILFGAAAILAGRAVIPGREGQIRKMICAGSTAVSGAMLVASALVLLKQKRAKDAQAAKEIKTDLVSGTPVMFPGDTTQGDDEGITVILSEGNDGFEIKYEITFVHTDEFIP